MIENKEAAANPVGKPAPNRKRLAFLVTLTLITSTMTYQGYQAFIAFDSDDTNHLETPLLLATARQLSDGPSTLYGPFTGTDPLVLMHAPLYYRMSGLIALPIAKSGLDPVRSAMISGRSLACFGFILTMLAAWQIARSEGGGSYAGLWAALLIASSPVYGSTGFTVRPDTLGIAFQTIGFGLVLRGLQLGRMASLLRWIAVGACFGTAFCIKQHLIVTTAMASALLLIGTFRSRVSPWGLLVFALVGAAIPLAYYSWEDHVTGGMMSQSVFLLPMRLRKTAGAPPWHVVEVFFDVAKRSVGELVLALGLLIGGRKAIVGNRIDGTIWLVFLAETASLVPLSLGSTGAWSNYAMPAVVWGSILLARVMSRAMTLVGVGLKIWLLVPAGLLMVGNSARLSYQSYNMRQEEGRSLALILADSDFAKASRPEIYFESRPQWNRLYGNAGLAYDAWMYTAYESLDMAESRKVWLVNALSGPIRVVVAPANRADDEREIQGVPMSLEALGYRIRQQYGPYAIWNRGPIRERF